MAEYCDDTDITGLLPLNHGFTAAQLLTFRTRGSDSCDAWLRGIYRTPLPNYGDTPSTPADVRQAAKQYSAVIGLSDLGMANQLVDGEFIGNLRKMADDMMRLYQDGKKKLPTVIVAGEGLAFGTLPRGANEHKLINSQRRVDPDTVEIAGYQLGVDFRVAYQGRDRGWILTRIDPLIVNGMTVSYEYTYHPNASEIVMDIAPESNRLYRV